MPTWRDSLTGPALGPGNARSASPAFVGSEFARRWKSILHSPRLLALATRHEREIVFVPHPNLEHEVDWFGLPAEISVRRFSDSQPIQEVFQKCALLVTDYSSKAFDVAYLGKPVVYYQFDPDVFFGGGHLARPGYFNYERDGFGPVVGEEGELLDAIESHLNGVPPDPVFNERAAKTFVFRDGRCCERVFEAILALNGAAKGPGKFPAFVD
jgi:CDP-glycerol glycerophosphotransferase (TagB/SpsB family)